MPCQAGGQMLWPLVEMLHTPSRAAGMTEAEECAARFSACEFARDLARRLTVIADKKDDRRNRVQVLACYYLQLFFMFFSLCGEEPRVVAIAAVFLACKVSGMPRLLPEVLRVHNQLRASRLEADLMEDEQSQLRQRIGHIELKILRIIRFDFDLHLPFEDIEGQGGLVGLADELLARLPESRAFAARCEDRPPVAVACALRPRLLQDAAKFTNDAFMGLGPLLVEPRAMAAGVLVCAMRCLRREMSLDELCQLLLASDLKLQQPAVKLAIQEVTNVFQTKRSVECGLGSLGASAAAGRAARPGPAALPAARVRQEAACSSSRSEAPQRVGAATPPAQEPARGSSGAATAVASASSARPPRAPLPSQTERGLAAAGALTGGAASSSGTREDRAAAAHSYGAEARGGAQQGVRYHPYLLKMSP